MTLSSLKFNASQVAQIFATGFMLMGQYFLLKQEIRDNKTFDMADKTVIDFRLARVEKCCGISYTAFLKPEDVKLPLHE